MWADEVEAKTPQKVPNTGGQVLGGQTLGGAAGPSRTVGSGQTIGQSPQARFSKPIRSSPAPVTRALSESDDIVELDWAKVDTDEMEREAIASTPGSSQRTEKSSATPSLTTGTSFQERLKAVTEESGLKRKREEDEETPKRPQVDLQVSKAETIAYVESVPLCSSASTITVPPYSHSGYRISGTGFRTSPTPGTVAQRGRAYEAGTA
jgi:hypothetical protein